MALRPKCFYGLFLLRAIHNALAFRSSLGWMQGNELKELLGTANDKGIFTPRDLRAKKFPDPPPWTPIPQTHCDLRYPGTKEEDGLFVHGDFAHLMRPCDECSGIGGWCQDGRDAGCPCWQDCPEQVQAARDQLHCSEYECIGENGVCTHGPQINCPCRIGVCPAHYELKCDVCGVMDNSTRFSFKCNGSEEDNFALKGCSCTPSVEKIIAVQISSRAAVDQDNALA